MYTSKNVSKWFIIVLLLVFCVVLAKPAYAKSTDQTDGVIRYVKAGGNGDCSSWEQACELQNALATASSGDQIWVAAGTYKPTTTTDRNISFVLKSGVAIYGGFPAEGGDWSSRDWETNTTTLSGDIGTEGDNADNSIHVVTGNYLDENSILDGFTITLGNANASDCKIGGGMYLSTSSPLFSNLIFSSNSAFDTGGGIDITYSDPTFINVIFSNNQAGWSGAGMYNDHSNSKLINVTFSGNRATIGGGIENYECDPILTNVTFSGNSTTSSGGGISNVGSNPTLINVTFSGNSAISYGGGMYNSASSKPTLINVTFSGNSAPFGGGGIYGFASDNPIIINSILWGNTPNQVVGGTPSITYSDIQGGFSGVGNIDADPLLGSLADNGGFTQTHALLSGSPAIDSGSPDVCPQHDQRFFTRPVDGDNNGSMICDMGAYEYNATPITYAINITLNGDGNVTKNPNKTSYYYGDIVELTANASPGWTFSHWSGDATGSTNPVSFFITHDINITAHFTQDEYTLTVTVDPENSGTVSFDPDQATYHYGDVVTLTATPAPGWSFSNWTGDATGTTNPVEVTITKNTSVTAHFTQDEYTLTVIISPENGGSVTIEPAQQTYHYSEQVTLSAMANPYWSFIGWDGDASGTDNPLTITILGNTEIIANFQKFWLYLPLISR